MAVCIAQGIAGGKIQITDPDLINAWARGLAGYDIAFTRRGSRVRIASGP
jgi:hypothetical protein